MRKHIRQIRIEGNVAYVTLSRGLEAVIDVTDVHLVEGLNWYAHTSKKWVYAKGSGLNMHRVILDAQPGLYVDHRDGNGLNNRRENLRIATKSQNQCNQRMRSNNTSGFKGVSKNHGRWQARIELGGKRVSPRS